MAPTPDVLFSNYERQVHAHAPDPVTRQIAMLAARNDALAGTFGLNEEVFGAAEAQQLSSCTRATSHVARGRLSSAPPVVSKV
jgi:hypothetical protein